jgi:putative hydroxymethylpyrimidine transport system substrate-binding protein
VKKILFCLFFLLTTAANAAHSRADRLTVVLDWFVNPDHAPLLVAQEQGFFRQNGVDVKLIPPADPTDGPKLVAAGKADIAITYQPQLLIQVDQGLPLVRVGALVDSPLACLVTLQSENIRDIQALKGKTIGYSADGADRAILQAMLNHRNLTLEETSLINVHYGLVQALLTGNIAAFIGGMRNVEPIELAQSGHPARVFYPEDNGVPRYDELIFVTRRQAADPRLAGFLRALQQAVVFLAAHPQASWEAAIREYPELDNAFNKAAWLDSIRYFARHPADLDKNKYAAFAEFMYQHGLIRQAPEIATYTQKVSL